MKKTHVFHYGGQALIEGVMMRGRRHLAIALRLPNGGLKVTRYPLPQIYTGRWREVPFLRGILVLVETLALGLRALLYSADAQAGDKGEMPRGMMWGTLALALGLAVALFFVAPLLMARLLDRYLDPLATNLVEGFLRLGILITYLWGVGRAPDIQRVFAYHGAEHKAVNAYEAGAPLEVATARKYSTAHYRCGTSFLLVVLVLAIIVFSLLGRPSLAISIISRVVLLPAIAALGYEFIHLSTQERGHRLWRPILGPGLVLQTLTTREPDDGQLEVALSALREVLLAESETRASLAQGQLDAPQTL